jgi:predicted nucleic acid-binding protein
LLLRTWQLLGEARADEIGSLVHGLPVDVVLVKEPLAREAARVKAQHPLSLADAFDVVTARLHSAPILTGNPEILALPSSVVSIRRLER